MATWIKATDSKPVNKEDTPLKIKDLGFVIGWYDPVCCFWKTDFDQYYQDEEVEWLDESPIPTTGDELKEEIENLLEGISTANGAKPLSLELCSDIASEIMKIVDSKVRPALPLPEKDVKEDEFIKKHLAIIRQKTMSALIETHIVRARSSLKPSIEHFLSGGNCNGMFREAILKMLDIAYKWKGEPAAPALPLSVVEELEKANPWSAPHVTVDIDDVISLIRKVAVKYTGREDVCFLDIDLFKNKLKELMATSVKNAQVQPLPLSIVEKLEKANPYANDGQLRVDKCDITWRQCVSTLRELIKDQPEIRKIENVTPESLAAVIETYATGKFRSGFGDEFSYSRDELISAAREVIEVCRIHASVSTQPAVADSKVMELTNILTELNKALDNYWNGDRKSDSLVKKIVSWQNKAYKALTQYNQSYSKK